jgi:CO/xanthine dehydrogenase FAD-binding subunit
MRPVYLPETPEELWEVVEARPEAVLYAGGTDLLVRMRKGLANPSALICLERIEALRGIRETADNVVIGAGTTLAELLRSEVVSRCFPLLTESLRTLGSPHVRNMGTVGGNICTASPAGDTLPPLYVYDAEVEVERRGEAREMPVSRFIRGPGKTILTPGELLTRIILPKGRGYSGCHYEKVGLRRSLAIAVASFAAVFDLAEDGRVESIRMAWGSVGPTVVVCPEAEEALRGRPPAGAALAEAAEAVRRAVRPISDVRAGADYRRRLAGNLVLRLERYGPPGDVKV